MSIQRKALGTAAAAASGNVTPSLPAGFNGGDFAFCHIRSFDNVNSTMPAGWTALDAGTNNGASLRSTLFYRVLVEGDANPLVTHTAGGAIAARISTYSGVDQTNPIDVTGTVSVNAAGLTILCTGVTTVTKDTMLVAICVWGSNSVNFSTGSSGMSVRWSTNAQGSADIPQAASGASGNKTFDLGGSFVSNGQLIGLKTAADGAFAPAAYPKSLTAGPMSLRTIPPYLIWANPAPITDTNFIFPTYARGIRSTGPMALRRPHSPVLVPGVTFPTQYAGLRAYFQGAVKDLCLVAEADAPSGMGGVIKIRKGGVNYVVYLVETTDANASPIRVKTTTGIKAIRLKT